jgi:hypothetical protein
VVELTVGAAVALDVVELVVDEVAEVVVVAAFGVVV